MVNLMYKLTKTLTMLINNFSSCFLGKWHLKWILKWSKSRNLEGRGRPLRSKLPKGSLQLTTEAEFLTIQRLPWALRANFEGPESPYSVALVLGPLQELEESRWLFRALSYLPELFVEAVKKHSAAQNDSFPELPQSLGIF